MLALLAYVAKSLGRNRTRTILTLGGVAVSTFTLCLVRAIDEGMANVVATSGAETKLVVYQKNRFCYATSRLPERYVARIAAIEGVERVVPFKVYVSNCRASLDAIAFEGAHPDDLLASRKLEVVDGSLDRFRREEDAALVGRALARRRSLSPGSRFKVGNVVVNVAAIVAGPSAVDDNLAFTHLRYLQRVPGLASEGYATQIEVFVRDPGSADRVAREIDALTAQDEAPTDTRPERAFLARKTRDLADVIGFARVLGWVCALVMLALLANTVLMAVQDRVREHAVLQAIGYGSGMIFLLVLAESTLASLLGGGAGAGLAAGVLAWTRLGIGTEGVQVEFALSLASMGTGVLAAVACGAGAGVVPALMAARLEVAEALRAS